MRLQHFIGGAFVGSEGDVFRSVNPTRPDELVAEVPLGGGAEASQAVLEAQHAFAAWAGLTGAARADHLIRWARVIESRKAELAEAMVREVGKPIGEAMGEAGRCVAILNYYAGEAVREIGDVIPALAPGALQFSVRQPVGVVALITPWNFPFAIPLWKAAPALAAGCTVVLKPSEHAGLCGQVLADTAREAELPAGVFNVVQGMGAVGEALVRHAGVKAISFTGSERIGRMIQQAGVIRGAKVQAEMGGKNVAIVLADADLAKAAALVAGGAMRFAGQKCTATSRVIVDRSVQDAFLVELQKAVDALPVADPKEASSAIGPVIFASAHERLNKVIADNRSRFAFAPPSVPSEGWFVPPVVIRDVEAKESLAQDELFGPVLSVIACDGLDQAIEIANGVRFGLSASLLTRDTGAALKYAHRIEAGLVRVNGDTTGVDPHAPFGGFKASSSHSREQGPEGTRFYTEIKTVQINP
jgi:aldehyde dehydrogenase (NAD+)